jgi:hypothetical protein
LHYRNFHIYKSFLVIFPQTHDHIRYQVFERVIDCCMTLTKARTIINNLRLQERLPSVDYRINAEILETKSVALTKTSVGNDFFGPTMNMSIKDYSRAPFNGLVVGLDLYKILKKVFFFILLKKRYKSRAILGDTHQLPFYASGPRLQRRMF